MRCFNIKINGIDIKIKQNENGDFLKPNISGMKTKTQLKPAHEPICLAMKPLSEKNFADNVMKWGTGGLNIDGTRVDFKNEADKMETVNKNRHADFNSNGGIRCKTKGIYHGDNRPPVNYEPEGRYPANLIIHENIADVLDKQSGYSKSIRLENGANRKSQTEVVICPGGWKDYNRTKKTEGYNDEGGASRFFKNIEEDDTYTPFIYHAKASKKDRNIDVNGEQITVEAKKVDLVLNSTHRKDGSEIKKVFHINNHATVKPTGLMKYLLKMGLPPVDNAVVLDMFAGSGSTGVALEMLNKEEGTEHTCILIEREEEYAEIIKKRCCLEEV